MCARGKTMAAGRERANRYPSVIPSLVDIHVGLRHELYSIDNARRPRRPLPTRVARFLFYADASRGARIVVIANKRERITRRF